MLELVTIEDLDQVMQIIEDARIRMKRDRLVQWQDGYPNRDTIINDIRLQQIYKLVDQSMIMGICVINDDYYNQYVGIPSKEHCLVIHRVAVSADYLHAGVGRTLITQATKLIEAQGLLPVIDTNSENLKMIGLIQRCGFEYVSSFAMLEQGPEWNLYIKPQLSN